MRRPRGRHHCRRLALGVALALATGCANRAVPPKVPIMQSRRADLHGVDCYLRSFAVLGAGTADDWQVKRLQERFLDYVESTTQLSNIYYSARGAIEQPSLIFDVTLVADQTTYRTYVLDLLAMTPWTFGILNPTWGTVDLTMEVTIADRNDLPVQTFTHEASADFRSFFLSWWTTAYVADSYTEVYRRAFKDIARQIAATIGPLRVAAGLPAEVGGEPGTRVALGPATTRPQGNEPIAVGEIGRQPDVPEALRTTGAALAAPAEIATPTLDYDLTYVESNAGFHLITEPEQVIDGTLWGYLRLLGGVELAGIFGFANVASELAAEDGTVDIANGAAQQTGWRISSYSAPDSTGLFWYPILGFMSQEIKIGDFREDLPVVNVSGASEIPGICSDPDTGEIVDPCPSNIYQLSMNSGFVGMRAGFDLVLGSEWVKLFLTASGGVNLVEYRNIRATIAAHEASASRWNVLRSLAVGGTLGLAFPTLHVAFRFICDYEQYLTFGYAEPLEFKGPTVYDSGRSIYLQPRVLVNDARLSSFSFQLATAVIF